MSRTIDKYRIPASFRDPAGFVYFENGRIFRKINEYGKHDFDEFISSGLADELIHRDLIIPFEIVDNREDSITILPEYIPFITYPYEWSFSQLRDAAAATLEINRIALDYGFYLKDASAFNLALHKNKMRFIDHTSFTKYIRDTPWCAYKQFCKQFAATLLLMKMVSPECLNLLISNVDGIELDLASKMLPPKSFFNLFSLIHIHCHAAAERRYSGSVEKSKHPVLKKQQLLKLMDGLIYEIRHLKSYKSKTAWQDYYENTNYSSGSFEHKKSIVDDFCRRNKSDILLDLGANNGEFSGIAAKYFNRVIAADYDAGAVEMLYLKSQKEIKNLIPVKLDLFNPSPALGLFNRERSSFFERVNADCISGLALIHHLRVTGNWRIEDIARLFAMAKKCALIEFVPLEDSQMQQLLRGRQEIYSDWNIENVIKAFEKHFKKITVSKINGTSRIMMELNEKI